MVINNNLINSINTRNIDIEKNNIISKDQNDINLKEIDLITQNKTIQTNKKLLIKPDSIQQNRTIQTNKALITSDNLINLSDLINKNSSIMFFRFWNEGKINSDIKTRIFFVDDDNTGSRNEPPIAYNDFLHIVL